MEWLINRRRMMYNKAVPPAYVPFEDQAIWEYVCTFVGDYYETVITDNGDNTVNITKSFVSILGTRMNPISAIEKKRVVVETQTNVDNSGGTYVVGTTKEAIGITMKQMQAPITNYILQKLGTKVPGTLHHFEEFKYFTDIEGKEPKRVGQGKFFEHFKLPNNTVKLDFYTDWYYSPILDFPPTLTTILMYFWLRIRSGVTVIFRSATPPTIAGGDAPTAANAQKIAHLYVPSAYVDTYKENQQFAIIADRIEAVEGTDYEVFNDWEYDD